jgi:methylated-DNA-[protein]-cysteine S-methyltransferase
MIEPSYPAPGGFVMALSSYASKFDLAHMVWNTSLGPIGLVKRGQRLAQITLQADPATYPFVVERNFGSPGTRSKAPFDEIRRQIDEYLAGRRLVFRLPLDIDQGTPFQQRVWKALMDIPYGQTLSYKDVAQAIGQPSATRAVGGANGMNPLPIVVPCHRVVAADGTLGGFSSGLAIKKKLLGLEQTTRARVDQLGLFSRGSCGSITPRP